MWVPGVSGVGFTLAFMPGNWEAGQVKTTMDLPDELIREVKLRALEQRRPLKDLVADYLKQGLGLGPSAEPASSPRVEIGARGLPVIRCAPDAPATRMSLAEVLKLEQDSQAKEDLERVGIIPF